MEPITHKGNWWLPEKPDLQISGDLVFSAEDGATLSLTGAFSPDFSNNPNNPEIILGITTTGIQLTLYRCQYRSGNLPFGYNVREETYFAHFVFEGVHFEDSQSIRFKSLFGSCKDLDGWIDIYGFTFPNRLNPDFVGKTEVKYEPPNEIRYEIDSRLRAGVTFFSKGPTYSIIQSEVKITQTAFLIIESIEGSLPFEELHSRLDEFFDLHKLAIEKSTEILAVKGYCEANAKEFKDGKHYYPVVNIYYQPFEIPRARQEIIPQRMMFTFKDLNQTQIVDWFRTYDKHRTQIHLYRTLLQENGLFIETRFLNIAQALESLHRTLFSNSYISPDEFSIRRKTALVNVPDNLKDWVENALSSANTKSFKDRILELLNKNGYLLKELITDANEFANKVRDTRNEFVHLGKQSKTIRDSAELLYAIYLLRFLFESFMLENMGFSESKLTEIYKKRTQQFLLWGKGF